MNEVNMKQVLLTALLIFSVGIISADDKKVVVKKMIINTDQDEKNIDVNVEVEDNIMTLTIVKNGDEDVFKVDIADEKAMKALEEELEGLDVDVNVLGFMKDGGHDEDVVIFGDSHHSIDKHHFGHEGSGYLGVQIQDLTDQLRNYFKVKGDGGVLVTEVVEDSPADKAGLEAGDVITKVNETFISGSDELTQTIRSESPNTESVITVIRKGREKSLNATLGESEDTFSWFGGFGEHDDLKDHKIFMKKFHHDCKDDCKGECMMKKLDMDIVIPDDFGKMLKKQIIIHEDDIDGALEKLQEELEKVKNELKELKDS